MLNIHDTKVQIQALELSLIIQEGNLESAKARIEITKKELEKKRQELRDLEITDPE